MPPTLADIGIDKKVFSIAQKLAELPAEHFEQVRIGAITISNAHRRFNQAPASTTSFGLFVAMAAHADNGGSRGREVRVWCTSG